MSRPRVSVLLPCRDAEPFLPACIESLRAQTLGSLEVLAVDDASRDGTRGLLEAWARRDGRVRLLEGAGEGPAAACDVALGAARGRFVARMDADDIAHPERLARQAELLEDRRELAACGTGVEYFPRSSVGSGYRRYERWINALREPGELARDLFVECPLASPTLMARRSVFRSLAGYRDRGWPEDYDFVLRLHAAGLRAANLPERLLRWRLSEGSLSRRSPAYDPDAFRRCKTHFLLWGFAPPERPLVIWGAGSVGKPLARALARRGRPPDAFVDIDPRKIGEEIHGAPVVEPRDLESRRECYLLIAVGSPGAREEIRTAIEETGRRELRDFRALA